MNISEALMHNQLISIGVLNLVVAALIYVLVKEKIVLGKNQTSATFVTEVWLRNVVVISILIIFYGVMNMAWIRLLIRFYAGGGKVRKRT